MSKIRNQLRDLTRVLRLFTWKHFAGWDSKVQMYALVYYYYICNHSSLWVSWSGNIHLFSYLFIFYVLTGPYSLMLRFILWYGTLNNNKNRQLYSKICYLFCNFNIFSILSPVMMKCYLTYKKGGYNKNYDTR